MTRVPFCFLVLAALPPVGAASAPGGRLTPVDTSGLMGSPEPVLPYDFEPAFPALKFDRPVAVTHAGDGSRFKLCKKRLIFIFLAYYFHF
jgi:hypothetical protein